MPAASNFRDFAMAYIGVANAALIPANANAAMLNALNSTLQKIFANEQKARTSVQVRGPTSITLGQVTSGSSVITFAGFQSWMLGCTVAIGGDALQNQFELSGASVSLNAPYQGSTQSNVGAVVYQDSINLTTEVKGIYPPALLNNQYYVEPLNSRSELESSRGVWFDSYATTPKTAQRPQWMVFEDNLPYLTTPTTRITFDSLPDTSYVFSFDAELKAPRVTSLTADTRSYFMPGDEDESILFPWALAEFMTWPQFLNDGAIRQTVMQQASEARARWATRTKGFTHTSVNTFDW